MRYIAVALIVVVLAALAGWIVARFAEGGEE